MGQTIPMVWAAALLAVLTLTQWAAGGWTAYWLESLQLLRLPHAPAPAPQSAPPPVAPQAATPAPPAPSQRPQDAYYAQLRATIRWTEARVAGELRATPDLPSRMALAKSAAERARLHEVGLGFHDVYGLINAETSWAPRDGASRDGTPNLGLAQFEPATAQALGVRDPHDVVEAVHAAAEHMREAALWSRTRIAGLKPGSKQHARALREGVSVYYNLSSQGRARWNGRNAHQLPLATQRHIRNARDGARDAVVLEARLRSAPAASAALALTHAGAAAPGG